MKEWGNYSKPKTGAPISYLRTKYLETLDYLDTS